MARPLGRRKSSGSSSSFACFPTSSLPPPVQDDILFEDLVHHLHLISLIPPIPLLTRTPSSSSLLRSKTHRLLTHLFSLVPLESPSRTHLGKVLFGMIFPHLDIHRRYNLKEGKLGTVLKDVLGVEFGQREDGGWKAGEPLKRWDDASFWETDGVTRKDWSGCMGEVVEGLVKARRDDLTRKSRLTVTQVDHLLNELASYSVWSSDSIQALHPTTTRRSVLSILTYLYNSLSPLASSLLTQLLLRDITPFLHPPPSRLQYTSLALYDAASIYKLVPWEVMDLWDVKREFSNAFRSRGNFGDALDAVERRERGVRVGVNVEIPKCQKGAAVRASLMQFQKQGSRMVYAETKYDGERMQIHINRSLPLGQQIKIFSKSKRDSTPDRQSTHQAILSALSLPQVVPFSNFLNPHLFSRLSRLQSCSYKPSLVIRRVRRTIILEAEMVPYNETKKKIEEFWKIVQCEGDRRAGWGVNRVGDADSQEPNPSDLHTMLVFFDILELDGEELLWRSYGERRKCLEEVVREVEGFSMLAKREEVRMSLGMEVAEEDLQLAFAKSLSAHEEGLVLKSVESRYNWKPSWVKLKRDYIPGLQDTIDLIVVGASWDKDRGRELNVSPNVFTTFFVGVRDESRSGSPHIIVLFSVSYGLTRVQLDYWNDRLQSGGWVPLKGTETHSYSFQLAPNLAPPMVMLKQPLLAEVFGAGFQKIPRSSLFELRWPRFSKIYPRRGDAGGKSWTEGLSSSAYRELALADLGRQDPEEEQPGASLSDSLDMDSLFTSTAEKEYDVETPLVEHGPDFWKEKIQEEVERESQEELVELEERGAASSSTSISLEDASDIEDEEDQRKLSRSSSPSPSPRKKRMVPVATPSSSPSLDKGKRRESWTPSLGRPITKHLQLVSNIVDTQVLPTPPPTSPNGPPPIFDLDESLPKLPSSSISRTPTKTVHPNDSGVCLSPPFPSSSLVLPSLPSTSKLPRIIAPLVPTRQEASTSCSSNASPRKRPRAFDSGSSPSISTSVLPPPPTSSTATPSSPLPSTLPISLPSISSLPTFTLTQLLQTAPIFIPPSHNIIFKPLNPTSLFRSAIDLLPFPHNLHPTLNSLLDSSSSLLGGAKLVLLSSNDVSSYMRDLEEIKSEVSKRDKSMGKVLVLDVWCLKWVPRKGEVEDWRRGLFWKSSS